MCAVAERLKLKVIATTDRRDFSRIRPRHVKSFELVPFLTATTDQTWKAHTQVEAGASDPPAPISLRLIAALAKIA